MFPSIFDKDDKRTAAEKTRQALTPAKQRKIKEAVGSKCELCGKKYPLRNLKIHHIEEVHKASKRTDLNTPGNLLVLCSICHDDVHHKPIPKVKQKGLIKKRSESVKKEVRAILRDRAKVNNISSTSGTPDILKISRTPPVTIKSPEFDVSGIFGSNPPKKRGRKTNQKKRNDDWSLW